MGDIPQLGDEGVGSTLPPEMEALARTPKRRLNYAVREDVRMRLKSELFPMLKEIRDRRSQLTQMWAQLFKVWTLEHENQGYEGRSNIYVPAGKKVIETIVAQLVAGTFPGDDNFGVESRNPLKSKDAIALKEVLKQRIENAARVRLSAEPFYRQLCITGNSPVKIYYEKKTVSGTRRGGDGIPEASEFTLYDGPVFEPIDVANFYAFPENVNCLRDCEIVFEDLSITAATARSRARDGVYFSNEVEGGLKQQRIGQKNNNEIQRLAAQGIPPPNDIANAGTSYGVLDITEVYVDFDPDAKTRDTEKNARPFLITFASSGAVLRAIENPFWHKRPPYVLGRMGTITGRLWGTGYAEGIRELNILLNDQTNQSMDCASYALNPVVLTNPNLIQGTLPDIEPGVQFLVQDINQAVRFDRPPMDLIQGGSILMSQTQSWINDYGFAPPVLQGGSAPGRAFRTATGIGTAQRNATVPINEIIRLCEADVWEQMLFHFWMLDQQFAEEPVMVRLSQGGFQRIDPRTLNGDWDFRWVASAQTSNQQVKGTQITQLLSVLAAPGMQQLFQANGKMVNPTPLVTRLYQEVYGFRDVEQVIVPAPAPAGAGQLPAGEAPPPVPGAGTPETSNELLSGNGEFGGMRMDADAISAALGSLGGMGGMGGGEEDLTGEGGI